MIRQILTFAAIAFFALEAAAALDCSNVRAPPNNTPTFKLICRGPMSFGFQRTTGDPNSGPAVWVRAGFAKFAGAAAADGKSLDMGTCAWADRAIAPSEPDILTFDVSDTRWTGGLGQPMTELMFSEFRACDRNANCRIHLCAAAFDGTGTGFQGRYLVASGARFEAVSFVPPIFVERAPLPIPPPKPAPIPPPPAPPK